MSATVLPFPSPCVPGATQQATECTGPAEIIPLGAFLPGLTQRDVNALGGLVMRARGDWCCEIEPGAHGIAALIVPADAGLQEPRGFMVSRIGDRLVLNAACPRLDWQQLGVFDSLEALVRALNRTIGGSAAA